jgi:hypothetical protein
MEVMTFHEGIPPPSAMQGVANVQRPVSEGYILYKWVKEHSRILHMQNSGIFLLQSIKSVR